MRAPDGPRRPPWFPRGLAGAFLVIVATEAVVFRHALDVTRQDNWEWRLSGHAASREATSAGVLAFGSSLVKLGVVPQVLEPSVGRPVFNLAVCAGSPPSSYVLLRRALDAGARPSAVVVEFHPLALTRDAWHTASFWPDLLSTRDTLELAWSMRDAPFLAAISLARSLPSLKDRHGLREALRSNLRGDHSTARQGVLALIRNVNRNRGAMMVSSAGISIPPAIPAEEVTAASREWRCSAWNERYVRKFLALARENGVGVVWLIPPVSPTLQDLRERSGLDARVKSFAQRWVGRDTRLVVVDGSRAGFDPRHFLDSQHLNRDGATLWSRVIARTLGDMVRNNQKGPRWVRASIARGSPVAAEIEIEDYGQSYRTVRRTAGLHAPEVRR